MKTPQEQHDVILALLRTRNLGGGQQGIAEWLGKPAFESEVPLSGDLWKHAFGIPLDRGDPGSHYMSMAEAHSRNLLEGAIDELRDYDHTAYIAINCIFNSDIGGYGDLEFFEERSPVLAKDARRGVWLLVAKLPPEEYRLYAEPRVPKTDYEKKREKKDRRAVVDTWVRLKSEGYRSKEVLAEIRATYGISDRRTYQILDEFPPDEESEETRGRPRKNFSKKLAE